MRKQIQYIALTLLVILFISACTSSNEDITQMQSTEEITMETTEEVESYPISTPLPDMQKTSYPITGNDTTNDNEETIQPTSEPLKIPEADPETGIVYGRVYSYTTNEVLPDIKIYLADKVPLEPGPGYTISFQEKSSPHAQTNDRGEFLILDINPGDYIPIMVTPFSIFPLANKETDELELVVESNQIYDLEATYVNWP